MFVRLFVAVLAFTIGYSECALQCGGRTYASMSPAVWTCCGGKPHHKALSIFAQCNNKCYNAAKQICCGNEIYSMMNPNSACCYGKFYQRGTHACTSTGVIDLHTHDVCRTVPYLIKDAVCCQGFIISKESSGKKTSCCGEALFDPDTEICCAEVVVKRTAGKHTKCCDYKPYDSQKHSCCDHRLLPKKPTLDTCCHGVMINSRNRICCGGHSKPALQGKHTGCCRIGEPFSPGAPYAENVLEYMEILGRRKRSHLGNYATFDRRKSICCSGKLNKRFAGAETGCCNREAYNVQTHTCCGNKISKKTPGIMERCCSDKLFDRKTHICCHGNVQHLIYGAAHHTFCCGTKSYDRRKMECTDSKTLTSLMGDVA